MDNTAEIANEVFVFRHSMELAFAAMRGDDLSVAEYLAAHGLSYR